MRITYVMAALLLIFGAVLAHGEAATVWEKLGILDPAAVLVWVFGIFGFFVLFSLYYQSHMGKQAKKLVFACIAVPVVAGLIYMASTTVYLNMKSVTGGPVHWHADYEVWACGESHELVDPEDILSNKVGTEAVHEHNDNRMHIEGIILSMEDASVGEFFEAVGGEMSGESFSVPTTEGLKEWTNGDLCNGQPAKWHMFVNGDKDEEWAGHVIAPYGDVPPGDLIKFVFTEKAVEDINTEQFEVP